MTQILSPEALLGSITSPAVPGRLLRETFKAATDTLIVATDNPVAGFIACAELTAEHADPAGWWITFAWTDPTIRGTHVGTELLLEAFDRLPEPPAVIRRGDHRRGPRFGVWSRRFGYTVDDRPWRYLYLDHTDDLVLFTTDWITL